MFEPYPDEAQASGSILFKPKSAAPVAGDGYMLGDDRGMSGVMPPRQPKPMAGRDLDGMEAMALHNRLMGHYHRELERQAVNRRDMAIDEDFYDHIQWTDEELLLLEERGQAPLVFNLIQTSVNWVLGTQRRQTTDYKILPRKAEGAASAERKSELLRHLRDANLSEHVYSKAFASAVKAGVGWLETGQGSEEDGVLVYDRTESWRNILWDSLAERDDLTDARYIFRTKWLDVDVADALIPGRRGAIEAAASDVVYGLADLDDNGDEPMDAAESAHFSGASISGKSGQFNTERRRVRVVEAWFKRIDPEASVVRGGQFNGELFDPWSAGHIRDLTSGRASIVTRPREVIWVALMVEGALLDLRPSPYRHNRYPFTPIWGYRRARDGMPYGIIRGMRDINRDLNKRASKSLHLLSSVRVFVEEGAVDDIEELRDEAGRPDAVIVYKPGRNAPVMQTDQNLAAAHIDLMSRDAQMIQQISGVTDENLGRRTNAASGKAIVARQDQGALATSMFFDNLRFARATHGEKLVVNVEQFYDKADDFRVVDARGNPRFITINDGQDDNAIALFKADYVITEEDWRATTRQAQAEELLDLAGKLAATAPQIVVQILDLVVEAMDVPKRDEFVKRIRQITGAEDPDADPNNPTPEMAAKQQEAAQQAEMAMRAAMAELAEKEAKARKLGAEAAKVESGIASDHIGTMRAALEAAIAIAGAPAVAQAADEILGQAMQSAAMASAPPQPEPPAPPAPPMMEGAIQ